MGVFPSLLALALLGPFPPNPSHYKQDDSSQLVAAIRRLQAHIQGDAPLESSDIQEIASTITSEAVHIADNADPVRRALKTIEAYESSAGPLFLNPDTRNGFPRKASSGLEVHRALFALQQALLDHAFTPGNLVKYRSLLEGAPFKTSAYFPGPVDAAPNPSQSYRVKINASQPAAWGSPVMFDEDPARRPTGCYLAPGSFATVTVPKELVGKGFSIRVGAHSWDLKNKPVIKRLDRVSLVFPIETAATLIANPLGGGIYIEVPPMASAGLVDVSIKNVVRSPFFSSREFDKTSLAKWRDTERKHPGPWADFESDRFMMQVPTKWIYAFDDPATLMKDWDKALNVVSALFGYPEVRPKSVLYLQVDVVLRGSAFFPGYPQSNFLYSPHAPEKGLSDHWLLKGPQSNGATIFHELGHAQLFTKFRGETEAAVNLPYVAVLNKAFGVDLDLAFGRSFDNAAISLDQAAIMWMVTQNFRDGKPMDISNSEQNEVRYQHRGYAKYVEVAKLFGWETLEKFWRSFQLDYMKGERLKDRNADPTDSRIFRLSKQAGVDLTPLIHFWGVHPEKPAELRKAMANNKLRSSAKIFDRLKHYMDLIPMSRDEFAKHASAIYPKGIRKGQNPNFGVGWYEVWLQKYDRSHGESAKASLQKIIYTYFPEGRPVITDSTW
ncbi:MAG: M60 family metallopeptidase [Fimbriimonadaceae bacterium]|nr:M60 family metallopeptidase [Fimbriimonadaceae bacterium]